VNEEYTLYDYQKDARACIDEITKKGKNIIIVGGTGLYIKSVLFDYNLSCEEGIQEEYEEISTPQLYKKLKDLDPLAKVDSHNRRRIVRAINYYKLL